jgi:hypothetical protein
LTALSPSGFASLLLANEGRFTFSLPKTRPHSRDQIAEMWCDRNVIRYTSALVKKAEDLEPEDRTRARAAVLQELVSLS